MRSPGLETRLMPAIVRVRSAAYFMVISRVGAGRSAFASTAKPAMKPSRSKMAASASFSFELGIFTVSNWAELALRIRVSMSAMGSVIVMGSPRSPTRLRHAGDLPGVHHRAQADPAQPELAEHGLGPAASLAPGIPPHLELRDLLLLLDQCLLCHNDYRVSCRNGKPNARKSARPCSSVWAVVTMVMSIPRIVSMRS